MALGPHGVVSVIVREYTIVVGGVAADRLLSLQLVPLNIYLSYPEQE